MKIVLAEVPYTKDRNISVEQSCCPEGAELVIAVYDEHSDDNSAFYREIEDADIIVNGYVYFRQEGAGCSSKSAVSSPSSPPAITR